MWKGSSSQKNIVMSRYVFRWKSFQTVCRRIDRCLDLCCWFRISRGDDVETRVVSHFVPETVALSGDDAGKCPRLFSKVGQNDGAGNVCHQRVEQVCRRERRPRRWSLSKTSDGRSVHLDVVVCVGSECVCDPKTTEAHLGHVHTHFRYKCETTWGSISQDALVVWSGCWCRRHAGQRVGGGRVVLRWRQDDGCCIARCCWCKM